MTRLTAFVVAIVFMPCLALAQAKPSPAEIKKVLEYYYGSTNDAVVIVDTRLCRDVATQGENKNECTATISSSEIEVGQPSFLWMNFFVPAKAGKQKILVQFNQNGVTRMTRQFTLSGSIRFRSWKKFALDRPGKWTVKILQDKQTGVEELASFALTSREEGAAFDEKAQPPVSAAKTTTE